MTNVDFHLQLNHNETWSMSRLHFHDYYELFLPLTSPGNIFVSDQVYPLRRGTLYLIGEKGWNNIHTSNKKDIFDFFDEKGYSTKDFGSILKMLGYTVKYNSDGTLTAYW